jgi:hypothetical protein
MNLDEVIAQLQLERQKIEQAIAILESLAMARPRSRGRPRKTLYSADSNRRVLEPRFPHVSSAAGGV